MGILVTLLVGAIVGWLATLIMKTEGQTSLIGSIMIGLLGSLLGFWGAAKIGIETNSTMARWAVAVVGAVVLIVILRFVGFIK